MAKPVKPLEQQIDEYKSDVRFKPYKNSFNGEIYKSSWNWDDNWDGQLIKDVIALEQAGFTVVSFSRKRKVTLKTPNHNVGVWSRANIVGAIELAVGNSWYSISFKPTLSIYWKGRSSNFRY